MEYQILKNINQIIERDSKDTTYKFALLRATIELIQERSPHQRFDEERVILPMGLLILKWVEYYYPIIENELPQRNGDNLDTFTLSFRKRFKKVTDFYSTQGGLSVFYSELMKGSLPNEIEDSVFDLCKRMRDTIRNQPMRYIGKSVYGVEYGIFEWVRNSGSLRKKATLDANVLIENFGEFSIPRDYYNVMELMGSFVTGMHSILIHWAKFTVNKDRSLDLNQVLGTILESPLEHRNTTLSQKIFSQLKAERGNLECVWTGGRISDDLNIDHILPFSIWRNNDLWNLLPTKAKINGRKDDKIPSIELLNKRKDSIISYWTLIRKSEQIVFDKELSISLVTRKKLNQQNWESVAFESLQDKCSYLIKTRGFQEFNV